MNAKIIVCLMMVGYASCCCLGTGLGFGCGAPLAAPLGLGAGCGAALAPTLGLGAGCGCGCGSSLLIPKLKYCVLTKKIKVPVVKAFYKPCLKKFALPPTCLGGGFGAGLGALPALATSGYRYGAGCGLGASPYI